MTELQGENSPKKNKFYSARFHYLHISVNFYYLLKSLVCNFSFFRCNYSIRLIVSELRVKYAKLFSTGLTHLILTIPALSKRPFFT